MAANDPNQYSRRDATGIGSGGVAGVATLAKTNDFRLDPQIEETIRRISPSKTPFQTLMETVTKSKPVKAMTWAWQEEHRIPRTVVLTAAETTVTEATHTFETTEYLSKYMVLQNSRTGEQVVITAIGSSTQAEAARAFGTTAAQASAAGDVYRIIGTVGEEAMDPFHGVSRGTEDHSLHAQEIGWAAGLSEWAALTAMRGGGERDRIATQAVEKFKELKEAAMLFSEPKVGTGPAGQPAYTMAGLRWFCRSQNVIDLNGVIDWDGLAYGMIPVKRFAKTKNMTALCGQELATRIASLPEARNTVQTRVGEKTFGFAINRILMPDGGYLGLVAHDMFDDMGLSNEMLVTSFEDLRKRVFRGYKIREKIQTNGAHRDEWELSEIFGLEHLNRYACCCFENVG